jgi:hypothetical protein
MYWILDEVNVRIPVVGNGLPSQVSVAGCVVHSAGVAREIP